MPASRVDFPVAQRVKVLEQRLLQDNQASGTDRVWGTMYIGLDPLVASLGGSKSRLVGMSL